MLQLDLPGYDNVMKTGLDPQRHTNYLHIVLVATLGALAIFAAARKRSTSARYSSSS